ncbi:MAG: NUDIX domain-containing protein [Prevotella sp.]|nr:NUDIX domain-containing protein [Prevotella sp.]
MKQIEVVAAIIRKGDKIFATQRGYGEWKDWWEFPGGKMEPGEAPEEALHLNEHEAARWLTKDELDSVQWLPADVIVVKKINMEYG